VLKGGVLARGVVVWLLLSVVFVALDVSGWGDGLALPVPLIVALVTARALERTRWAGDHPWRVALAVVAGCAVVAVLAWAFWLELFGLGPEETAVAALVVAAVTLLLLPARLRAVLLRPLGLEPGSAVHVVTVAAMVLTVLSSIVLFVELQDEPSASIPFHPTDSLISVATDLALALAGVGFLLTRDLKAVLARLDLRPIRLPQVGWAAVTALAFNIVVGVMEWTERLVLPSLHALEDRFDYDFVGLPPLVGAALVSLAAGVGEEILFRGALQPRIGIGLSAALFAILHVQYQIPGILMIFVVGVALGLVKQRTSTTFTIVVHVVYDLIAFLADLWP
jgi:membrane protease YdiL (CAAX protease family)